jgi:hypothetical protein
MGGWPPCGIDMPNCCLIESADLRTPKLLAQNRRSLCIDPVHLKNMLR